MDENEALCEIPEIEKMVGVGTVMHNSKSYPPSLTCNGSWQPPVASYHVNIPKPLLLLYPFNNIPIFVKRSLRDSVI